MLSKLNLRAATPPGLREKSDLGSAVSPVPYLPHDTPKSPAWYLGDCPSLYMPDITPLDWGVQYPYLALEFGRVAGSKTGV